MLILNTHLSRCVAYHAPWRQWYRSLWNANWIFFWSMFQVITYFFLNLPMSSSMQAIYSLDFYVITSTWYLFRVISECKFITPTISKSDTGSSIGNHWLYILHATCTRPWKRSNYMIIITNSPLYLQTRYVPTVGLCGAQYSLEGYQTSQILLNFKCRAHIWLV
jgi:hypothetical protein